MSYHPSDADNRRDRGPALVLVLVARLERGDRDEPIVPNRIFESLWIRPPGEPQPALAQAIAFDATYTSGSVGRVSSDGPEPDEDSIGEALSIGKPSPLQIY